MQTQRRSPLKEAADAVLHAAVHPPNGTTGVPGVVAMATDGQANVYEGAAGVRELGRAHPMTTDTVFMLRSTTKAITGVAVMQLVEEGRIGLHDPAKDYVPEIADIAVLEGFDADGEPQLRPPKSDITVSQLLLHTAGFGYDTFNADLVRLGEKRHLPSVATCSMASLRSALLFDPGERWEYGTNLDWAGKVAESAAGKPLGTIMRERIFTPLGMNETSFTLLAGMRERKATTHHRAADGSLTANSAIEHPAEPEQHMGGHGLYGTVGDYMKFIRMILSDGAAPDGTRVLKAETVRAMASNALGSLKIKMLPGAVPSLSHDAEFFPGMPKSWGYTWMINEEDAPTGRPAGELAWAGLANLFFWIDRKNGVGGFWATQILPFMDDVSLPGYLQFETAVYASLTR